MSKQKSFENFGLNLDDVLWSRDKTALYLGVQPSTLASWFSRQSYHLPVVKVGGRAMYRKSDLDAFIKRRTIG